MNRKLRTIVKGISRREEMDESSFAAHEAWAASATGAAEISFAAEHFKEMDLETRTEAAEIAARTGVAGAVPLVLAGLEDSESGTSVAAAVRYATIFGTDPAFRSAVAPAMVRWLPRKPYPAPENAVQALQPRESAVIEALPKLDPHLATQVLATSEWLRPDEQYAIAVFQSFNAISLVLPLELITQWLAHWENPATCRHYEYSAIHAYQVGLFALARHRPEEAIEKAERLMALWPHLAYRISGIYLSVHGLTNLYNRICAYAHEPAAFAALPLPARVYYALTYFSSDSQNGGTEQALSNSTGDHFQLVLEGCLLIGDDGAYRALSAVGKLFGPSGPSPDRDERNRQMDAMTPDFETQEENLPSDGWTWDKMEDHINRYAAKHAEILRGIAPIRRV